MIDLTAISENISTTGFSTHEWIKIAIYIGSWGIPFILMPLLWLSLKMKGMIIRGICLIAMIPLLVFTYARFIEPQILITKNHEIVLQNCFDNSGKIKLAIVADMHIGLFGNAMPMRRIAPAIEAINPDATLIPGDFTYYINTDKIRSAFAGLKSLSAPVYAVLGNHDIGLPGPDLRDPLINGLSDLNVKIIDNQIVPITKDQYQLTLIGLSDSWEDRQRLSLVTKAADNQPRLVLTHNPKTIWNLPEASLDLMITGHTHGGQIYIPYFTCWFTGFACAVKRYGYKSMPAGDIFVTAGTGMVGLPLRLGVIPRIDVLNLSWQACPLPQR